MTLLHLVEDPNLIKRPVVTVGSEIVPGSERERLREILGAS